MSIKKTLILLAILLGLGLYIKLYELPQEEVESRKNKIFNGVAPEEIESVSIRSGDKELSFINKNPHAPVKHSPESEVEDSSDQITGKHVEPLSWQIKDLPEAILDPGRINSLVSSISTLESENTIAASEIEGDRKIYGLEAPELMVSVSAKGKSWKLSFGKLNEFVGRRYLAVDGDSAMYLVSDALFTAASVPQNDFRDKTPITFTDESVKGITVQSGAEFIEIVPAGNSQWKLTSPLPATGSSFAVFDIFRNLRNLKTEEFIDTPGDFSQYGLTSPHTIVTIKRTEGDIKTVFGEVGDKEKKIYFRINDVGPVYGTTSDPGQIFPADVSNYREKQLFRFDNFFAQKITVEKGDATRIDLVKGANESWTVNGKPADLPFVREYIKSLSDTQVDAYPVGSQDLGFTKPLLKITVQLKAEDKVTEKVLFVGIPVSDSYPAAVNDFQEPFYISSETFQTLNISLERLLPASNQNQPTVTPANAS